MQNMKRAGDIDGYVAVERERNRFAVEATVPLSGQAGLHPAVARAAALHEKALADADAQSAKRTTELRAAYLVVLKNLVKTLMAADRIADAKAVGDEMKKADFGLAEAQAKAPKAMPADGSATPAASPASSLRDGLVLWYGFDRDEKDKVTDKSGKGNDGKVNGAKWTRQGQVGGAMEFDGNGDYVDAGRPLRGHDGPFAVMVRFKTERQQAQSVVGMKPTDLWQTGQWQIQFKGSQNDTVEVTLMGSGDHIRSSFKVCDGEWHRVVVVFDKRTAVYCDGAAVASTDGRALVRQFDADLLVGTPWLRPGFWFQGSVDEVMVWNRALSDAEVKALCGLQPEGAGKAGGASFLRDGLVLWYGFDADDGNRVSDKSGRGNDGRATGAKWTRQGQVGGAMEFDGRLAHVTCVSASRLRIAKEVTLAAWVKPEGEGHIMGTSKAQELACRIYTGAGRIWTDMWNENDRRGVSWSGTPQNGWFHVVGTYDGSEVRLYLNGTLVHANPQTGRIRSSSSPLFIGARTSDRGSLEELFRGLVDEVMVWNRALSEAEVSELFRQR
jgi:hypothetical protein